MFDVFRKLWRKWPPLTFWPLCRLISLIRLVLGKPPSVSCWLQSHPNVKNGIKWQCKFQSSAYDIPEAAKVPWRLLGRRRGSRLSSGQRPGHQQRHGFTVDRNQ
jgi:hypothetical protein